MDLLLQPTSIQNILTVYLWGSYCKIELFLTGMERKASSLRKLSSILYHFLHPGYSLLLPLLGFKGHWSFSKSRGYWNQWRSFLFSHALVMLGSYTLPCCNTVPWWYPENPLLTCGTRPGLLDIYQRTHSSALLLMGGTLRTHAPVFLWLTLQLGGTACWWWFGIRASHHPEERANIYCMKIFQGTNFHLTKVLSSIIIVAFELKMSALINMVIIFFLPPIGLSQVSLLQPNQKDFSSQKKRAECFMKQFI